MTKTASQIKHEMETVKLIKETLDVTGVQAHKLYKEWTTDKSHDTEKDEVGEIFNIVINIGKDKGLDDDKVTAKTIAENLSKSGFRF